MNPSQNDKHQVSKSKRRESHRPQLSEYLIPYLGCISEQESNKRGCDHYDRDRMLLNPLPHNHRIRLIPRHNLCCYHSQKKQKKFCIHLATFPAARAIWHMCSSLSMCSKASHGLFPMAQTPCCACPTISTLWGTVM